MRKRTCTALAVILTGVMLAAGCGKGSDAGQTGGREDVTAGASGAGEENADLAGDSAQDNGPEADENGGEGKGQEKNGGDTQGQQEGGVELKDETYAKEFQADDGQTLVELKFTYPVIGGDSEADKAMNEAIAGLRQEYETQASQAEEILKEDNAYQEESVLLPYGFEAVYEATYNQDGYLQIRFNGYDFTGGAHGNPWEKDFLFDAADGKELSAEDVFVSPEAERTAFTEAFTQKFETEPELFFPDAMDTLDSEAFVPDFYLAQDGLHFYAMPYELGPYAAGTIDVVVPYSKELIKLNISE